MIDLMIDLETMSMDPNAAIVSLGAVFFDKEELGPKFYNTINLASSVKAGGKIDSNTIMWWMKQGDSARLAFVDADKPIALVLTGFQEFLRAVCSSEDVRIWGNGAAFDNVLLRQAYMRLGWRAPWLYKHDCCYRTLKVLYPDIVADEPEGNVHHNALSDAIYQATHLQKILRRLNV
jgi:hypothetical protein